LGRSEHLDLLAKYWRITGEFPYYEESKNNPCLLANYWQIPGSGIALSFSVLNFCKLQHETCLILFEGENLFSQMGFKP